jgi:endonuclease I
MLILRNEYYYWYRKKWSLFVGNFIFHCDKIKVMDKTLIAAVEYLKKNLMSFMKFVILLSFTIAVHAQPNSIYYSTVDTSTPELLRSTLHEVINDHFRFPYTSTITDTWDILELASQDPSNPNNIIDIYKNSSYPKVGGDNTDYNREHTWPTSLGFPNNVNANYPYTDMHHLFLSNDSYNFSRGNKYYDYCIDSCVEKPTDQNNGVGGIGESNYTNPDIWEVWNSRKGDIARGLLYLDVRYEGGINIFGYSEPDLILTDNLTDIFNSETGNNEAVAYMGLLSVLISWHYEDSVDDFEMQHNNVIETYQTNRNPFVDHPEWVACVFELICDRIYLSGFE